MMNASPAPQEIFLLKLGEVVLKGQNRQSFEDKLLANVRRRVKNCGSFQCSLRQSTIYVEPQGEDCDMEAAWDACRQVFGIAAVARAVPCEKTVDAIVEAARTYLADAFAVAKSFKVESKRADKMFPMNSIQLSQAVGGDLAELFPHVAVDVHTPDLTVFVEIREKYAYVHTPSVPGAGGLPIGMGGRAVSLLSGGIDSPVSSWMMARRGVELEMVHFVSPPYTSQQAQDKVLELARLTQDVIPAGVFNVITGSGSKAGQYILDHPGFRKLAFTGSTEVGGCVACAAAERLIPSTLELGGKSANIIFGFYSLKSMKYI